MLIQPRIKDLQGELYSFKSNKSLLLDDRQTFWVVQSGSLAIFAIPVEHGTPVGKRRYLFRMNAFEAMFSTIPDSQGQQQQILAVSLEETTLLKVSRETFGKAIANNNPEAIALVEGWIHQLGLTLSDIALPIVPAQPEGINYFSLAPGEIFQSRQDKVSWVRIQQGCATWMGLPEFRLTSAFGMMPLSAKMWVKAEDTIELESLRTSEIQNEDALLDGLSLLQTYVLQYIDKLERQDMQQEFLRFQERQRLDHQVVEETLGELASVLQSPQAALSSQLP
ncbi:ABC transporter-related protein (plasmid) [Scytonema sp. HK-05]|nr:ABC transporter-related protein [Scytonema sp. HK-05]